MQVQSLKIAKTLTHVFFGLLLASLVFIGFKLSHQVQRQANIDQIKIEGVEEIEKLKSFAQYEQLKRFIESNLSSDAQNKISYINGEHEKLESKLGFQRNNELDTTLESYKTISDQLSRLSRPEEILTTMSNKVTKLTELASKKRWKNLTRSLERLDQRIGVLKVSGKVESNIVKYMESDLTSMVNLIKGSALEDDDKTNVLKQLEAIQSDLIMLLDLHEVRKSLNQTELQARVALEQWSAKAHLALGSIQKIQMDAFRSILSQLWLVLGMAGVFWGLMSFLGIKATKDQTRFFENKFFRFLKNLKNSSHINPLDFVSQNRGSQFEEALSSFQVAFELGDDFDKGMPFSSFIMNQNGELEWANSLFYDQFGLDSNTPVKDLNLDLLNKKIIASQDYVAQALESMQPATWQIQLQMDDGVTVPMEMHLSPIEKDEGKLLVIFYDLVLIKEAIQTQSHLIMHPVRSALESLEQETWGVEMQLQLAPLWKKAGLEEDWNKLCKVVERLNQYRFDLLEQVKRLDSEKKDHLKLIIELHQAFDEQGSFLKNELTQLKKMRDVFIALDQTNSDLQTDHQALTQLIRTQIKRTDFYWEQCRHLADRLTGLKDAAHNLEVIKSHYKTDKAELIQAKQNLVKYQNDFLMSSPMLSGSAQKIAADMKDSMLSLDRAIQHFDKNLSTLDIEITKVAMAFTGAVPQLEKASQVDIMAHERMLQDLSLAFKEDQELMIELLHGLVKDLKSNLNEMSEHQEVVKKSIPEVFEQHP